MNEGEQDGVIIAPVSVIESQERANIDMLVATAKRYPRDLKRVRQRMEEMATADQETAESCTYHLERDGHAIEGPSVKLAEIAIMCYQNIRFGTHIVSNDGKVVTAQGFCHDTENNTFGMMEVQRRITDKKGRTYSEDMQITTAMAASAIAYRNAVFKVIPSSLVRSVEMAARRYAVGDLKTLIQRRSRALKRFASIGVREDRILAFLGYENADQIVVDDIERLFGIYTAIKEESTTIEETFGPSPAAKPNIPAAKTKAEPPPPPAQPPEPRDDLDMSPPPPPPQPPPPISISQAAAEMQSMIPPPKPRKSLLDELNERIVAAGVTTKEFLTVVAEYAFSRDAKDVLHTADEVQSGAFTMSDIGEKYLKMMSGSNFAVVIAGVEKMRRGEEP